jgi:hypothetical protein
VRVRSSSSELLKLRRQGDLEYICNMMKPKKKDMPSYGKGGKMPMYMYGGKVYADSGAMIKAMLKDPKQAAMARKELGMD